MKGVGVPFVREFGESSLGELGAMSEAEAADVEVREGEAPHVFAGAIEMLVDGPAAPVEAFLGVEDPFGLARGAASGEGEAGGVGIFLREHLRLFSEMGRRKKAQHRETLRLIAGVGKG